MTSSFRLQSFVLGAILVLSGSALLVVHADNTHSGQWMLEPCGDKTNTMQLTVRYNERGENERNDGWGSWGNNTQSHSVKLESLAGLSEADLKSAGTHVKFRIVQDAGSLENDGWFANGKGSGHFDYVPNPQFAAELKKRGFSAPTGGEQFRLTMAGFKLALLDELKQDGYAPFDVHMLVKIASHGVEADYVHDMKAAGYKFDNVETLTKMRDHGVTAGYIAALNGEGFKNLDASEVLKARDHGVGPDFIKGWKALGFTSADIYGLIRLRDHGVTPEYANEMSELGYKNLRPEELTRLRDHGVTADFAREVKSSTSGTVTLSDLVRLKDHGVSASLIRAHKDLSLDEVIRMRDRGERDY